MTKTWKPEEICVEPEHTHTLVVDEMVLLDGCDGAIYREEPDEENTSGLVILGDLDDDPILLIECLECFVEEHPELVGALAEDAGPS